MICSVFFILVMSENVRTSPSMVFLAVRYGKIRMASQPPSTVWTSRSLRMSVWSTSCASSNNRSEVKFDTMSDNGRPISLAINLLTRFAAEVNRLMRSSLSRKIVATSVLFMRFCRSSFALASDDLQNLMNSTEVATIFLDNELRIKRFTSAAKRVSKLIASDIGRPLSDIVSHLTSDRLLEDAQDVLQTLILKERDVQTVDGGWLAMRILPYRTAKNTIDGLGLTFSEITKMKKTEQIIQAANRTAASIVET